MSTKSIKAWRAWYADGQVYDSVGTAPDALPRTGLVCLMEYETEDYAPGRPYRRLVQQGDWYWWDGEHWQRSQTGDWGTWTPQPRPDAIQSTAALPEAEYDRIIALAMAAREAPG